MIMMMMMISKSKQIKHSNTVDFYHDKKNDYLVCMYVCVGV